MKGDALLVFSDNVDLTTTANSSVIDFGAGGDSASHDLAIMAQLVGTAAPTTAKVTVSLQLSDNSSDWTTVRTFAQKTGANANAGQRLVDFEPLPYGMKRYARLAYTVADGPFTAGKVFAIITPSREIA
jgi:hypothetical protein